MLKKTNSFAALLQLFFTEFLVRQRALSPCTIAAYRDSFSLLLTYAQKHIGKAPTDLHIADLTPDLICSFLDYLEDERGNSVRSRNARLAAIRSFLKFISNRQLCNLHTIEQVLAIPMKRFDRPILGFLSRKVMQALLEAQPASWLGQRDRLLLSLLYNTGARVSEVIGIRVEDINLDATASVHLRGKGRKQRTIPLWKTSVKDIRQWLQLNPNLTPACSLLPTRDGTKMTRANVALRLKRAAEVAAIKHPEIASITITPHTLRHTTAMHLLQSGVDISVIALWLGHESPTTTHMYIEADLTMKQQALGRLQQPELKPSSYRPPDSLLKFLKSI
jgi:site-specific recombinase XerD